MGAAVIKYGAEGLNKIWSFITGKGAKEVAKEAPKVTKESLKEMGEYASKQIGNVAQKGGEAFKNGFSKLNEKFGGKLSIKGGAETSKVAEKVAAQSSKQSPEVAAAIQAMANGGGGISSAAMEKLAAKEGASAAKTAEKAGAKAATEAGKEAAEGASKVATKGNLGKSALEFVKKHPKGTALAAGAGTVVVAPELAGKAVTATAGAVAESSAEFTKTVATEVGNSIKESGKELMQNMPSWILPAVGIGAGALLLGGGGLGSIAKVGALAGIAYVGYNAIKGMSQPANEAIAQTMDGVEKQSRTDTLFGKSKEMTGEVQREMVDTSNISEPVPETSQQQFS